MKVISKNCSKKPGRARKRKNMAAIGANAYLTANPKIFLDAVPAKKIKKWMKK